MFEMKNKYSTQNYGELEKYAEFIVKPISGYKRATKIRVEAAIDFIIEDILDDVLYGYGKGIKTSLRELYKTDKKSASIYFDTLYQTQCMLSEIDEETKQDE